jgi:hypothetical protein
MIIAIDYDNTYTTDPELFNKIILLFQESGHTVICVTGRDNDSETVDPVLNTIGKQVGEDNCEFTCGALKKNAAKIAGFDVDIWIDDTPGNIEHRHKATGGWSSD